jgi:ribosome-binding factor A
MVSITAVEVSRDIAHARVYVTLLGCDSEEAPNRHKVLQGAAGSCAAPWRERRPCARSRAAFPFDSSVGRGRDLEALIEPGHRRRRELHAADDDDGADRGSDTAGDGGRGSALMAKRRRGRPVSGILLLDKPAGMSSNQALQRVKRLYGPPRPGIRAASTRSRPECCRCASARRRSSPSTSSTPTRCTRAASGSAQHGYGRCGRQVVGGRRLGADARASRGGAGGLSR